MSHHQNNIDEAKIANAVEYCKQQLGETGRGRTLPQGQAAVLLYGYAQKTKTFLNLFELQEAVPQIEHYYNKVMDLSRSHVLTVGGLKKSIQRLPDNTPVLYQRIEDSYFAKPESGWKTIPLLWESHEIKDAHAHLYENAGPYVKIIIRPSKSQKVLR